jgi:hypothetical protein
LPQEELKIMGIIQIVGGPGRQRDYEKHGDLVV